MTDPRITKLEERVTKLDREFVQKVAAIDVTLLAIQSDISEVKVLVGEFIKLRTEFNGHISLTDERWEAHRYQHRTNGAILTELKTDVRSNMIGIAKTVSLGGAGGAAVVGFWELIQFVLQRP